MGARPIRTRIPYEIDMEMYVYPRPRHSHYWHTALLSIPVLCGVVYLWLGNYWQ